MKSMKLNTALSRQLAIIAAVATLELAVVPAAGAVTFSGNSGSLAASVSFNAVGTDLQVTLTNTATSDVLVPADVLTGVFFNLVGGPTLAPASASLNGGSTVQYGSLAGGNAGAGWQYLEGINQYNASRGISAAGLGIFGPTGNFPSPVVSIDGLDYGLLSAGDNISTGNTGVTGSGPLIQNSVVFTLSGLDGFVPSATDITNITFQYGTALNEPHFSPVPEPGILSLIGAGLVGMRLIRRRRRS